MNIKCKFDYLYYFYKLLIKISDLLFLEGLETVFRISLSILKTFEPQLLSCDSFEEIMDYFKTTITNLTLEQAGSVFSQVNLIIILLEELN